MIAVHPQATTDPAVVEWVIPAGLLDFVGQPSAVPAPVRALIDDGLVAELTVFPARIVVRLGSTHQWRTEGARVRAGLLAGLAEPSAWKPPLAVVTDPLTAAINEVLAGEVGDYIRSHHGQAVVTSITGDSAEVSLTGTCGSCPARGATLHDRLETEVRKRYPHLSELRFTSQGRRQNRPRPPQPVELKLHR